MKATNQHKWTFPNRFRARVFGWRASKLACKRLKEAVSEIKKVAKADPIIGAEGTILLMEKLWPALEHVDSSSGALGTAVNKALNDLLPILINAPADRKTRDIWLDRLWQAKEEDGVDYLSLLGDRWGEVCGSKETASTWADELIPIVRHVWADSHLGNYFHGTTACLSCLLTSGRYQELLYLLKLPRLKFWDYRRYGVDALIALNRKSEALEYAEASRDEYSPNSEIDRICEDILLSAGRYEEAYHRYGLTAHTGVSYLSRFRSISKRYPMKDKAEILNDLIVSTPGEEGKWFATAKELGLYDLALKLASENPCDPKTLNRAARDNIQKNSEFALGAALASLKWLATGWGYEITSQDVLNAYNLALQAAENLGITILVQNEVQKIINADRSQGKFVQNVLAAHMRLKEKTL